MPATAIMVQQAIHPSSETREYISSSEGGKDTNQKEAKEAFSNKKPSEERKLGIRL